MAVWAYIYKISNDEEGKSYIGSTTGDIKQRMYSHRCTPAPKMKHLKPQMKDMAYEVLEYGFFDNKHEMLTKEDYYMDKYNTVFNGYNTRFNTDYKRTPDYCESVKMPKRQ
jgi:hypothetical protein